MPVRGSEKWQSGLSSSTRGVGVGVGMGVGVGSLMLQGLREVEDTVKVLEEAIVSENHCRKPLKV